IVAAKRNRTRDLQSEAWGLTQRAPGVVAAAAAVIGAAPAALAQQTDELVGVGEDDEGRRQAGLLRVLPHQADPHEPPGIVCVALQRVEGVREGGDQQVEHEHVGQDDVGGQQDGGDPSALRRGAPRHGVVGPLILIEGARQLALHDVQLELAEDLVEGALVHVLDEAGFFEGVGEQDGLLGDAVARHQHQEHHPEVEQVPDLRDDVRSERGVQRVEVQQPEEEQHQVDGVEHAACGEAVLCGLHAAHNAQQEQHQDDHVHDVPRVRGVLDQLLAERVPITRGDWWNSSSLRQQLRVELPLRNRMFSLARPVSSFRHRRDRSSPGLGPPQEQLLDVLVGVHLLQLGEAPLPGLGAVHRAKQGANEVQREAGDGEHHVHEQLQRGVLAGDAAVPDVVEQPLRGVLADEVEAVRVARQLQRRGAAEELGDADEQQLGADRVALGRLVAELDGQLLELPAGVFDRQGEGMGRRAFFSMGSFSLVSWSPTGPGSSGRMITSGHRPMMATSKLHEKSSLSSSYTLTRWSYLRMVSIQSMSSGTRLSPNSPRSRLVSWRTWSSSLTALPASFMTPSEVPPVIIQAPVVLAASIRPLKAFFSRLFSLSFLAPPPRLRRLAPPPDRLLPGERLLHVGASSDGGAVALTNYRLLLIGACGRLSACLPAGILERPAVIADAPTAYLLNGGAAEPADSAAPTEAQPDDELADSRADAAKPGRREASRLLLASRTGRVPLRLGFPRPGDAAIWAERLDPAGPLACSSDRAGVGAALRCQADDRRFDLYAAELSREEFLAEQVRLGLISPGSSEPGQWRQAESPAGLCPSYPRLHILPAGLSDAELALSAKYRANGRFPSVVWRCSTTGAVLARSAQPLVGLAGLLGWRCEADEKLVRLLTPRPESKVLVADARPYSAALGNGTMGGGYERPEYYSGTEIEYLGLPNLHAVRNSFAAMRVLLSAAAPPQPATPACPGSGLVPVGGRVSLSPAELESTGWLQLVSSLLSGADRIAQVLTGEGRSVLVHCSDGWDRTPQLTCLSLLLCDPHYRTLAGFRLLLTREWLDFGHKFADRCGNSAGCVNSKTGFGSGGGGVGGSSAANSSSSSSERSPIFLQFLDCAHQLLAQFPQEFEFTDLLLRRLAVHCHSGLFPALAANTAAERAAAACPSSRSAPGTSCGFVASRIPDSASSCSSCGQPRLRLVCDSGARCTRLCPTPGWTGTAWTGTACLPTRMRQSSQSCPASSPSSARVPGSRAAVTSRERRPEAAEEDSVLQQPPPPSPDGRIAVQS
uniref:Myotubularin phosphatase domain-containing protein n=1 Tax=Macrostomum lignano TaxID=282301 RepID=A0A1I8ITP0_9PLAT